MKRYVGNKIKKSRGERIFQVCNTIFMLFLCVIMFYPLYYIIIYSFNQGADSMKGGLWLFPRILTLFNYEYVLGNGVIQKAYVITIARTVIGTFLGMTVTGLTAYGMSFRNLPHRNVLLVVMLIPMLFGGGLIPYYIQLSNLKLVNTFWVFVIPGMMNIWNMFVMMKSFMGMPESLREAALLDGAGEWTILFKIVLPLSKATLAAIALFTAVGHWNDWYTGAFYVNKSTLMPLQTYLQRLFTAQDLSSLSANSAVAAEAAAREPRLASMTITSVKMAAVVVGTLPILCIYPFIQKYFVKGVMVGSVKG